MQYGCCSLSALVSRTFCDRCMVFTLCYMTLVHFQHWWVGRSATGVWCSHCAIWLLYTFSTGESDVLRPVYGVHTVLYDLYTFSTGESDVLRPVYGVHTVLYDSCTLSALVSRTFCDRCMVFILCYMTLVHFQHWWVGRSATGVWCSHCAIWLLYTFSTGESDVLRPVYGVHTVLYDSCTLSALVSRTFCDWCMVFTLCYTTLVHFQHWWVGRSATGVWCSHCAIRLLYTFSTGESDVLRPVYGVHIVLYDSCTLSALVSRTFCDRCMVFTLCYMTLVHFQHWWVGRSATGVWCSHCAIWLLYTFSTGESDVLRPVYGVLTVLYDSCTLSALVSRTFCDRCMVFTLCYMTLVHFQHWWVGRSATGVWCSHCAIWLLYTFSTGESDVLRPVYGVLTVLYDSCTLSALVSRTFCNRCMVFTLCYMTLVHFQHWWVGRSATGVWCSHCAIWLLYTFSTGESDVLRPVYGVHTVLYDSCTLSALVSRTFCDRCMVFSLCYMTLVHFQHWWVGRSATGVWCSHCAIWLLYTFSTGESDVLRPVYGVHTVLYDSCTLSALVSRTFCDRCMVFTLCYMTLVHFQHWWVGRSATGVWCSHCAIWLLYTFSTGESDVLWLVYGVLTVLYDSCTLSALVSRTFCDRCMVFSLCYMTLVHFQHWWVGRSATGVWCSHCAIWLLYTFSTGESDVLRPVYGVHTVLYDSCTLSALVSRTFCDRCMVFTLCYMTLVHFQHWWVGRSATGVWCSHCAIWLLYTFSTGESDVLRPVYGVHTVLYDSCTLSALVSRTFCDRCMVFTLCYMTLVHFQHWWVGRSATGVWCSHCAIWLLYTFSTGESDVLRPVYGVHTVLYDSCTLSALVSRTFCDRCMVFTLCYMTLVHFQHWWVGRSATGVWCSHCAIWLLYTFSTGESDVLRPVYGVLTVLYDSCTLSALVSRTFCDRCMVFTLCYMTLVHFQHWWVGRSATGVWCSHCAIWLLYTFSTGESDVLRPVYGVHTVLYDSCTLSALVSRTFCDRCMVFTLCYMTLVHFQHWWVGRSATGVWCSHCAIWLLYTFSTGESDVLRPVYGVHTVLYDSCTLSALVSQTFCDQCMVFTLCYMTLVHFQHWWVGRSATGVWCSYCAIRLLYTFSTGESDVLRPVYGVHTVLYDSCTLSALVSRTFCDRCMVFTLCYTTLVHFQHWWVRRSATGVWCSYCAIWLLYTFSTGESDVLQPVYGVHTVLYDLYTFSSGESDVLRPVYGVHTVLYDSCTLSALVSRTFCDRCMVFTLCYMTLVHFQHWWVRRSATGVWCSHCAIWLLYTSALVSRTFCDWCMVIKLCYMTLVHFQHWWVGRSATGVWWSNCYMYTFSTGGVGCSSWCDGSSDRSFMGWTHWPISRSSQCSTRPWYVLSCMWDSAYKRTLAVNR